MASQKRRMVLKKIPLSELIKLLEHIYESGANFVDIIGEVNGPDIQDEIMVAVRDEYMNLNYEEDEKVGDEFGENDFPEFEQEDLSIKPKKSASPPPKLTASDLNKLIDEGLL